MNPMLRNARRHLDVFGSDVTMHVDARHRQRKRNEMGPDVRPGAVVQSWSTMRYEAADSIIYERIRSVGVGVEAVDFDA